MKRYPDNMEWPEYGMNPCSQHTLIIETTYNTLLKNIAGAISNSNTILAWNVAKIGSGSVFVSAYSKPKADYDFIDLDALARNIAQSVWSELSYERDFS